MKYRKLDGYKYDLQETYKHHVPRLYGKDFINDYISLFQCVLTIKKGYAWDGASGPTWDDKTNMRGSLVHDALYQIMREGGLSRVMYRKYADKLLIIICLEDGMNKLRAKIWYRAVRMFCGKSSLPRKNPRGKVVTIA